MTKLEYLKALELQNKLKNKEDFRVIYDGEDFGVYSYNQEKNRYEGRIGHITIDKMIKIINGSIDFIVLK